MRVTGYLWAAVSLMWVWVNLVWPATGLLSQSDFPRAHWCDTAKYFPSSHCCCDLTLHHIPTNDCQCCGIRAYRWNETPASCKQRCGNQLYHQGTQLCCGTTVFNSTANTDICCAGQVHDSATTDCCFANGAEVPVDRKKYRCCNDNTPYRLAHMRCDRRTGKTFFKNRQLFQTGLLCNRQLPVFNHTWPLPEINTDLHTRIRAIPDTCKFRKVEKNTSAGRYTKIHLPLSSFAVVGRHKDTPCLQHSDTPLELIVKVESGTPCATVEELQEYLHGKVVEVVVRKDVVCRGVPVRAGLRLKEGHNALIFIAGTSGSLMAQALMPVPQS